jgi:Domain of unknown function (DUF6378)
MDVVDLTNERAKAHGDFTDVSDIAQRLKSVIRTGHSFDQLSMVQVEGLDMILHKIARIVSGNPNHKDHWDDIAGYAHIVSIRGDK